VLGAWQFDLHCSSSSLGSGAVEGREGQQRWRQAAPRECDGTLLIAAE